MNINTLLSLGFRLFAYWTLLGEINNNKSPLLHMCVNFSFSRPIAALLIDHSLCTNLEIESLCICEMYTWEYVYKSFVPRGEYTHMVFSLILAKFEFFLLRAEKKSLKVFFCSLVLMYSYSFEAINKNLSLALQNRLSRIHKAS